MYYFMLNSSCVCMFLVIYIYLLITNILLLIGLMEQNCRGIQYNCMQIIVWITILFLFNYTIGC